jgi:DNA-directed RNA polymerase specialized sigma24 family protein
MHTREPDTVLEALDNRALRARLARTDWERDPLFVADEQVFSLFRRARAKGDAARIGLFAEAFNERLLARSRKFVLRAQIFPGLIDDLKRATHELASSIWDQLLSNGNDAAHAEKAFGQFFERRAISFQRTLLPKMRKLQFSLDADEDDEGEGLSATDYIEELQDHNTPDLLAARQQAFELANKRLLGILTEKEYTTYVLLYGADWQVQEIAAALKVTVKSVNNYKRSALAKIDKEFKQ